MATTDGWTGAALRLRNQTNGCETARLRGNGLLRCDAVISSDMLGCTVEVWWCIHNTCDMYIHTYILYLYIAS